MVFVIFWIQPGFGNILDSKKYSRIIWNYLETLCAFGPRNPGSEGYRETLDLIRKVGEKYADQVVEHPFFVSTTQGKGASQAMVNLELRFQGTQGGAPILIGTHFDTRPFADEDPDPANRSEPILGANDGGSGTAILLGLAQYLSQHPVARPVHLVFFDGEDFGAKGSGLNLLGSTYYAQQLAKHERVPYWVLVIDMVGDKDLQIFKETHSLKGSSSFLDKIYRVARDQRVGALKEETKYTIFDDHYPFHRMGIPSTVLIDFDYPYWHTLQDTLDKCSIESMISIFSVVVKTIEDL